MRSPARLLLHSTAVSSIETSSPSPAPVMAVDSDMVVILASLLCALVCVLGLALLSRCACRRLYSAFSSSDPPLKGVKKAIDAIPTISFAASSESSPPAAMWSSSSDCAICLAEFAEGESVRVLPRCEHGFHVGCVYAWHRTRSTCPFCREAIIAVETTKAAPTAPTVVVVVEVGGSRCGEVAAPSAGGRCGQVAAPSAGGGDSTPTFLP